MLSACCSPTLAWATAATPSSQVSASCDLVGFEAHGSELARQLLVSGAGVGTPVVLVEVHEHVEHENTIPQRPRADGPAGTNGCAPALPGAATLRQPRSTRWKRWPGRRATRPCSSRSSRRADSSAAPCRCGRSARRGLIGSKPSASSTGSFAAPAPLARAARVGRDARDAGERRQLVDDVGGAVDQLGALLDAAHGSRATAANGSSPGSRTRRGRPRAPAAR